MEAARCDCGIPINLVAVFVIFRARVRRCRVRENEVVGLIVRVDVVTKQEDRVVGRAAGNCRQRDVNHIIDNYKLLRKEAVLFPPRSSNEKNLIFVKTESPILQNIDEIASTPPPMQEPTSRGLGKS